MPYRALQRLCYSADGADDLAHPLREARVMTPIRTGFVEPFRRPYDPVLRRARVAHCGQIWALGVAPGMALSAQRLMR